MAFHERLSRTQRILLAVFCFPLLPFYLCYLCCSRSKEDEKSDNAEVHAEQGMQERNVQSRSAGQTAETSINGQQPAVTSQAELIYVNVDIHPRKPTPHIRKKLPVGKGDQEFPKPTGWDNQGFQSDLEQGSTLSKRQDLYAYPWDKSNLKSMQIDLNQFKELDAYASKVNVRNSAEDLVSVLLQKAHSDLEKVRAIWIWICYHIEYDTEAYHHKDKRRCEPADVLLLGKSVCSGYAQLFQQMCSIAGVQCKQLSGFSKGYSYKPGMVIGGETDHAWNAVYLDGRWHLLDSTWGSGYVDNTCRNFTFRYNEFYFLTHPALFINAHFPEDNKWQLLKPTRTLQQYERNINYSSDFYTLGLLAVSAETAVIETENGKAIIFIESRSPMLFLSELNREQKHCLMILKKNGMKLEVYPPQTGTHRLDIFTRLPKKTEKDYKHVLEYSLKCSSVDKRIHLPKMLIQPVGPSWLSEEKGVLEALPLSPIIHMEDGRCIVTFTQSKDLGVFATLDSDSSTVAEEMRRRHIWKTCQGSQVELKIHLPHAGHFALHIWAKNDADPGSNHCVLSYLLSCPNKSVEWPPFPKWYSDWQEGCELVAPLSGVLPANRDVQFKLKIPNVAGVSVKCGKIQPLTLSRDGFWEGTCHTSGAAIVSVRVLKCVSESTFWTVLEYKVENQ